MPIKCPPAPVAANPSLVIQTAILKAGSALTRFHSKSRAGNIYNPNTGKRIEVEEEGARFNPFPGAPAANVATLYAADNLTAAALESIFHGVKHIPSPTFPRIGLKDSSYSELVVNTDLFVVELTNPQLRRSAKRSRQAWIRVLGWKSVIRRHQNTDSRTFTLRWEGKFGRLSPLYPQSQRKVPVLGRKHVFS
jgi:hypothetical protein